MNDASHDNTPPAPIIRSEVQENTSADQSKSGLSGFFRDIFKSLRRMGGSNGSARETLEELIEEREDAELPLDSDELRLVANILDLRSVTIYDVMVPRADIVPINAGASLSDVIDVATEGGHSRLPIFEETLDDARGMVHIKDVLGWRGQDEDFRLKDVQRNILFVSPSMRVLELLLEMRVRRCHMALVVDEFGGVDGLVTIEDLVEEIVGEIEDEHDQNVEPQIEERRPGVWVADARLEIKSMEMATGVLLEEDEREDVDTIGGLVFVTAGRVPIRGEIVAHSSGVEFEILEADPRRIRRVRIRKSSVVAPASDTSTD